MSKIKFNKLLVIIFELNNFGSKFSLKRKKK